MFLDGIDAQTIVERRGHNDAALPLQIYSQVTSAMHRDAADLAGFLCMMQWRVRFAKQVDTETFTP
jgi:hypothetical protein